MSQEFDYISGLEEDAKKSSGGGGIIGQCELNRGFKVFVSGMSNKDSFFMYHAGNESEKKEAQGKAKAAGNGSREQDVIELVIYKASVKGKEVTWKDDRNFTFPLWTEGFKQIVLPSIKATKPPLGQKFWAKVGFAAEPTGRKKLNQQGEEQTELVAFIAQVYKDEAEASADAGQTNGNGGNHADVVDPNVPSAYSKQDWESLKDAMVGEVDKAIADALAGLKSKAPPVVSKARNDAKAATIKKLAGEYEASEEQVKALIGE